MSAEGTVYDLGYKPHHGERLGRAGAIRAVVIDGLRRALGLRRKARSKLLPWALIVIALLPVVVVVSLTFLAAGFELEAGNPFFSHADYFNMIGIWAMLFIALVTPLLIIPDRQHGVIAIYASRPIRATDYLLARGATLAILAGVYVLLPHALLYLGISALNAEGFVGGLAANASEIPDILITTVALVLGFGAPAFLVSIFIKRLTTATGVFVVIMLMTSVLEEIVGEAEGMTAQLLAPLSLFFNPFTIRDAVFEVDDPRTPIALAGLGVEVAWMVIGALVAVTAVLAHRRYRRDL